MQSRVAFEDIDKLVLFGVGMAQGRNRARCELGEVDAKVGQTKQVAQRTLLAALHLGCERLWIVGKLGALGALVRLSEGLGLNAQQHIAALLVARQISRRICSQALTPSL